MSKKDDTSKNIVTAYAQEIVENLTHDEIDKLCVGLLDANLKCKVNNARRRKKADNSKKKEVGNTDMTQAEAKELLEKGHSISELIEIFEDEAELRDIYMNSGLVYPDFPKIVAALKLYKREYTESYEEGFNDCYEETIEDTGEYRLYVDMDGTLAEFVPQASMEPLYQKGYFLGLKPNENVVEAVKYIVKNYKQIKVFVLTAYLTDSVHAFEEKHAWLDANIPEIDDGHRIFVPNGSNKSDYVSHLSDKDFLLDDYTPNLMKWLPGRGIKLLNGINHSKGTWKYDRVSFNRPGMDLGETLVAIVTGQEHVYDEKDKISTCMRSWLYAGEREKLSFV